MFELNVAVFESVQRWNVVDFLYWKRIFFSSSNFFFLQTICGRIAVSRFREYIFRISKRNSVCGSTAFSYTFQWQVWNLFRLQQIRSPFFFSPPLHSYRVKISFIRKAKSYEKIKVLFETKIYTQTQPKREAKNNTENNFNLCGLKKRSSDKDTCDTNKTRNFSFCWQKRMNGREKT